ncbi:MAG: hypothetical protein FJ104_17010, partial [Deltaproteobacteria bacterium]|nr:hypothetical protein [Deltaproteobacteria bacterium]
VRRANVIVPLLLCALGWAALLAPWSVGRGKFTFHYHYFPSHAFTLIAVAGVAAALERTRPRAVLGYFALVLGVAVYFAPVWSEYPLTEAVANRRLVPLLWRP